MIGSSCSARLMYLVWAAALACGKPTLIKAGENGGAAGAPGSAGSTGTGSGGPGFVLPPDAAPALPPPMVEICATESRIPERPPVDLLFVIDASSSMLEIVDGGTQSKWQLAQEAILGFMRDPGSAGLHVGLQFFPLRPTCTSDRPVCLGPNNPPGPIPACPCPQGLTCAMVGSCTVSGGECTNVGGDCPTGQANDRCLIKHGCSGLDPSCEPADYRALAVPFAPLPGGLPAVMDAIAATNPARNSGTPTGVAVVAGLEVLRQQAAMAGGRRGALVLLTDGEPTKCLPGDALPGPARVAAIMEAVVRPVAQSRQAAPTISIFGVGVFSRKDITMGFSKVVTDVADAAGTRPFVLEANRDLTRLLQEAFNEIRSLTVACEYAIPRPERGVVDFGKVNVHLQSAMIDEDIPYVASADRCNPTRNGWYYDADPASGGTPTRVVLCPAACKGIQNDARSKVELRFGCKTRLVD
jgi:hypothetical protein